MQSDAFKFNVKSLKKWFVENQRGLPWREDRSPYAVWVSEMMLQQTQVTVVIPYFQRWMQQFPTIASLAQAPLDEVIKAWEGLGYYSRARSLHAGAQYILEKHQGIFPSDPKEISKIKGIGVYTLGAICSFAFKQRMAAVDGNVLRVLSRCFQIEEDIAKPATQKQIRELVAQILPEDEPWIVNEALIELGATICMRKPNCEKCPLKQGCQAFQNNKTHLLPYKSTKTTITPLHRAVAILRYGNKFLVRKGQANEIMSDLHEFPYFEVAENGIERREFQKNIESRFGCKATWQADFESVAHSFTRFKVRLTPSLFSVKLLCDVPEPYRWMTVDEMQAVAFSSGHRRVLAHIHFNKK